MRECVDSFSFALVLWQSASKGFFKKPDYEAAAALYDRAATSFRNAKSHGKQTSARARSLSLSLSVPSNIYFLIVVSGQIAKCVAACEAAAAAHYANDMPYSAGKSLEQG